MGLRPRNERDTLARAVWLDFAFIGAYAAFLVLAGALRREGSDGCLGSVGDCRGADRCAVRYFRKRAHSRAAADDPSAPRPRGPSILKWWSLFAVAGALGPLTIDYAAPLLRRWIGYGSAMAGFAAAAGGIYGLAHGNDKIIETAVGRLAIAWFLAFVFIATERTLRDGLHDGARSPCDLAGTAAHRRMARDGGRRNLVTHPIRGRTDERMINTREGERERPVNSQPPTPNSQRIPGRSPESVLGVGSWELGVVADAFSAACLKRGTTT